jgi:hypothetical protein
MKDMWIPALIAIIVSLGILITFDADYREEQREHELYCASVAFQEHSDYKHLFHTCKGYGITVNSQCRAISVGNYARPRYRVFCEHINKPFEVRTLRQGVPIHEHDLENLPGYRPL